MSLETHGPSGRFVLLNFPGLLGQCQPRSRALGLRHNFLDRLPYAGKLRCQIQGLP